MVAENQDWIITVCVAQLLYAEIVVLGLAESVFYRRTGNFSAD